MRVCLASAPTIAEFSDLDPIAQEDTPRIPLGPLSLASVLEAAGVRPDVVDLDALYTAWREGSRGRGEFARRAVDRLVASGADVYGFSTICSSYPLTLRIATALRAARPGCRIVLGGPRPLRPRERPSRPSPRWTGSSEARESWSFRRSSTRSPAPAS